MLKFVKKSMNLIINQKKEVKVLTFKTYWRYLLYILKHKWYVFVECKKEGLTVQGIFHDNSKFRPSEFFAYAEKFFSGDYAYKYFEVEGNFEIAWLHHEHRNGHHWGYWVNSKGRPLQMPRRYIVEMICDWKAMGHRYNDTAQEF